MCSEFQFIEWWKEHKMALKLTKDEQRVVRHQLCNIFRYPTKVGSVPEHTTDWEDRKWMEMDAVVQCIMDTTSIKRDAPIRTYLLKNTTHCKYWWTEGTVTHISFKMKGEPNFVDPWSLHPGIFN